MRLNYVICFFLLSIFPTRAVFAAESKREMPSPEKLLSAVKKNTDKIKRLSARITRMDGNTGEVYFTGKLFFKRPKLRINFTGPKDFEGVGLSAIRTSKGVVTVDADGYVLNSAAPAGGGNIFDYMVADITNFGKATVSVSPAQEYGQDPDAKNIRYYQISIRKPPPTEEEMAPVQMQNEFMKKLAESGQMPSEAYSQWQDYSRKRGYSTGGGTDCIFCNNDTDIVVDDEKHVIKKIYVLIDGEVENTIEYSYTYSGGKYIPSKVTYDDGETKFVLRLTSINSSPALPDSLFKYKIPG